MQYDIYLYFIIYLKDTYMNTILKVFIFILKKLPEKERMNQFRYRLVVIMNN